MESINETITDRSSTLLCYPLSNVHVARLCSVAGIPEIINVFQLKTR